jgi:hypothetical protein
MGFIIKQSLETNQGLLSEAYARIEMYRVDMFYGLLHTTVAMYPSKKAALETFPVYFGEVNPDPSQVIGVNVLYNGEEIEYPSYLEFPLVKDVEVEYPLYEDVEEIKTSTYYDFDENGEIVKKEREDKVYKNVRSGTQKVIKQKIDIDKGNIYLYAYEQVKKEFGKIFGDENIIDE